MATEIHVVVGGVDYESAHGAIQAFHQEKDAEAFIERIRAHLAKKPIYEMPYNEARYERHEAAEERWRKQCPGGSFVASFDSFSIHTISLV